RLSVTRRPQDRGGREECAVRRRHLYGRTELARISVQPAFQFLHRLPPCTADARSRALSLRFRLRRAAGAAGGGIPRRLLRRDPQGPRRDLSLARALLEA